VEAARFFGEGLLMRALCLVARSEGAIVTNNTFKTAISTIYRNNFGFIWPLRRRHTRCTGFLWETLITLVRGWCMLQGFIQLW